MSSILDALEKLESRRAAGESPEPPRHRPRSATPLVIGGALVAFAAGIGFTAAWLRPAPTPTLVAAAPTATPPAVAAPPATPPVAPATVAAAPRPLEQPWAEVVTPPIVRRAPEPSAAAAEPRADDGVPPDDVASAPEPTAEPAPRAPPPPAGAPSVRVSFLVYSSVPERRSVALTIDEGGLVTLQEGQQSGEVSVVEILPDAVALAWQGQAFTVPAQR